MENDKQTFEKALTSKDIAAMIGIAESTVRKYAAALEDAGYPFTKDGDGEKAPRIFTQSDAMVMRHLKDLREKSNLPVEQAAQLISAKHPKGTLRVAASNAIAPIADHNTVINAINERHNERFDTLEEKLNDINEFNKALLERLDERDALIRELAEALTAQKAIAATEEDQKERREKERDAQLMQVLREIQEVKKAQQEEAGKSVWSRIFGGK